MLNEMLGTPRRQRATRRGRVYTLSVPGTEFVSGADSRYASGAGNARGDRDRIRQPPPSDKRRILELTQNTRYIYP